jgi:hypothetical protein
LRIKGKARLDPTESLRAGHINRKGAGMAITEHGRAYVLRRIGEARTRAELEHFWQQQIGDSPKSDQQVIAAFYSRLKSFHKKAA